jgi:crotonobetainyl-CoA:carnitine CoA-transferase CaiB-like acyl-CoA transferase
MSLQPLEGIRVVDAAAMIAGPATAMLLGDLGADVVKIEPPGGDDLRHMNWRPAPEAAPFFLSVNRNKRDLVLDLRTPEGLGVLRRLLASADVLIHNFRPGVAERLGVGFDDLRRDHPRLIYCSISAWGERGPWAQRPGIDSLVQAFGGLMSVTGEPSGPFLRAGVPLIDMTTPLSATTGILAALMLRERTGEGRKVEVSLLSQGLYLQGPMFSYARDTGANPPRMGNRSPMALILEAQTPTGGMLVGIPSEKFWVKLCKSIRRPELADEARFQTHESRLENQIELAAEVEPALSREPREEWLDRLIKAGVPCAPINDYEAVMHEEQVAAIEAFIDVEHPEVGSVLLPNIPWSLGGVTTAIRHPPPTLGRDTDEVLRELGYTPAEIRALFEAGITRGMIHP